MFTWFHANQTIGDHKYTEDRRPVRSIVSTIVPPTNGVKHHGARLLRGQLDNCLHSEELARHLIWQLDVVNNRHFIPICLFYKLFLGRSGIFRLHHVG